MNQHECWDNKRKIMKLINKSNYWIKKLVLAGCILLGTMAITESALAQSRGNYGYNSYANPAQVQMLLAIKARAQQTRYWAQYWQKVAAELDAQHGQHIAIMRAQQADTQAQKYEEAYTKLLKEHPVTTYEHNPGIRFPRPSLSTTLPARSSVGRTIGPNWRGGI